MIEVKKEGIILQKTHSGFENEGVLNPAVIKVGDEITLGKTTLKILSYDETPKASKKALLDKKLKTLISENSPRLSVIESLTKRMQ